MDLEQQPRRRFPSAVYVLPLAAVLILVAVGIGCSTRVASAGTVDPTMWKARYSGLGDQGVDRANSLVMSPDAARVFVTGESHGDYATVAYMAGTGVAIWEQRYDGPGQAYDRAISAAVSPDGSTLFVTGGSAGTTGRQDYATIAYNASSGAVLWTRRYDGPGVGSHGGDTASDLAVTPDGTKVIVTGSSSGPLTHTDVATIAYDAATGAMVWGVRFDGPRSKLDGAGALAFNPDGTRVFVTGYSDYFRFYGTQYVTLSYDISTGAEMWTTLYDSPVDSEPGDSGRSLAVSPDGTRVFVTGSTTEEYATLAYDAETGEQIWVDRYDAGGYAGARSVAVSPDAATVFVTGNSEISLNDGGDYATLAYDASTGARLWVARYPSRADQGGRASSVVVSPDGTKVFVTGGTFGSRLGSGYATLAYDADTGTRLWIARFTGAGGAGEARSLVLSPDGTTAFVTGTSNGLRTGADYLTIAYDVTLN